MLDAEKLVQYAKGLTGPLGLQRYKESALRRSVAYINKTCPEAVGRGITDAGRIQFRYEGVTYECIVGQEIIRYARKERPLYEYDSLSGEVRFGKLIHKKHLQWVDEKKADNKASKSKKRDNKPSSSALDSNSDRDSGNPIPSVDDLETDKPIKIQSADDLKKFQMQKGKASKPKPKKKKVMKKSRKKVSKTKSAF